MAAITPEYRRDWKARNPESVRASQQKYERSPRGRAVLRAYRLKRRHGITLAQRAAMLAAQGSGCALCGAVNFGKRGPMVDHDHRTGRLRGILCCFCNTTLGWVEKRAGITARIDSYLKRGLSG